MATCYPGCSASSASANWLASEPGVGWSASLGFPVLMDGGVVTAPDLAIFTEDGWVVENVGVPPDIDVEQDPAAVAAGKDPQLDRAIEVVLSELEKNPPPKAPVRPPFPVRVRVPDRASAAK